VVHIGPQGVISTAGALPTNAWRCAVDAPVITVPLRQRIMDRRAEREVRRLALERECDVTLQGLVKQWPDRPPKSAHYRPLPEITTIYFIGSDAGPIKIGMAVRPHVRLRDLQLAGPSKLTMLATIEGPPSLERDYHKRFKAHRLHGEWFQRHPDIMAEIERLKECE
jgi:hypothetical protein